MKKIQLLVVWSLLLFFSACKDTDVLETGGQYESTGIIYGLDLANCGCCGNWLIEIDENGERDQFLALPQGSGIDLEKAVFPLEVKLNWRIDESSTCSFILIEDIELD